MTRTAPVRTCAAELPRCLPRGRVLRRVVIGVALVTPAAGVAQVRNAPPLIPVGGAVGCDATPRLIALSGGGRQKLEPGRSIRIPYGVPYRFMHRPGAGTDFVRIVLAVGAARTVANAAASKYDRGCYSVDIGELPGNVPISVVEQVGSFPSAERRRALRRAVDELRAEFIRRLYAGRYDAAMVAHRLGAAIEQDMPALLRADDMGGLVVRIDEELVPLHATISSRVVAAAAPLAALPGQLNALQALAGLLGQVPAACRGYATLSPAEQRRLDVLRLQLRPLETLTAENAASFYASGGVLPVATEVLDGIPAILGAACANLPAAQLADLLTGVRRLHDDPLRAVVRALDDARVLVEQSFVLTATEIFPGATTTLQRFGQLDVVNGYLLGRREVRLLASFSFYPGQLSYGGEIAPHSWRDRLVLNVGYSLATTVADDDDAAEERDIFTVGAGFRINQLVSVGAGQWFDGRDNDWYVQLSADIGAVPFLRELFARSPDSFR